MLGLLHNSRQPQRYIAGLAQSKSLAQIEQLVSRLWLFSCSTLPHCIAGLAQSMCVQFQSAPLPQLHCCNAVSIKRVTSKPLSAQTVLLFLGEASFLLLA